MINYFGSGEKNYPNYIEQRSLRNTSLGGNNMKLSAQIKYLRFVTNIDNIKVKNRR